MKRKMLNKTRAHPIKPLIDQPVFYNQYEHLNLICASRHDNCIDRHTAYNLYESNWRWVDIQNLSQEEHLLIQGLIEEFGEMNV